MKLYRHLSPEESGLIHLYLAKGESIRFIGKIIERPASTVSREIHRNRNKLDYKSASAHSRYIARRQRDRILNQDALLREFVVEKLSLNWTPEQISGRLKMFPEAGLKPISCEAIYQWLYAPAQKLQNLYKYLPRAHARRRWRKRVHRSTIPNRVSIHARDCDIDLRETAGHWEADLMSCQRGRQHILVMVERKTRMTAAVRLKSKTSAETIQALMQICKMLPKRLRRSVTFDNGGEFSKHIQLQKAFNMNTWFCDPYASWQKGAVENTNGRLRRDFPRKTELNLLTDSVFEHVIQTHNLTPRKCLGFKTPTESFLQEMGKDVTLIFKQGVALRY